MNDSCKYRLNRAKLRNNQVFALEDPKAFLHSTLALTVHPHSCSGGTEQKPNKISEKGRNEAANWRHCYVTVDGRTAQVARSRRVHSRRDEAAKWIKSETTN
jgi:hypothetical protein